MKCEKCNADINNFYLTGDGEICYKCFLEVCPEEFSSDIGELFYAHFDCYAKDSQGDTVKAMTVNTFVELVKDIIKGDK